MVVGGLLPMNVYMSQVVGTEPLAGLFSGLVIVMVLRSLRSSQAHSRAFFLLMGLFLGLSILTKVTAVLLVPSVIFFLAYTLSVKRESTTTSAKMIAGRVGLVMSLAVLVCGWYYLRNWIELGQFFVGGWEHSQKAVWWQEPGYRTLKQFVTYGPSLFYPVYSGVMGLWDSLYSTMWADGFLSGIGEYEGAPPWNYGFMLSSVWLSIFPSALIIIGIIGALLNPERSLRKGQLFAVSCVAVYFLAIIYLFLIVPIYSAGKATYTLGLIPCYAVLFAYGFDILTRSALTKALLQGIIGCWGVNAFLTYWVVR
jgi:succinate dehydrogenase hydrophobic anchor subunit